MAYTIVVDADDAVSTTGYTGDLESQAAFNYTYDAIGELTGDQAAQISNVTWNVYGKILSMTDSGNTISFTYDAAGNRISKTAGGVTTWYVRDASGNVLSTYTQGNAAVNGGALSQIEADVYGSSRLGVLDLSVNCGSSLTQPALRSWVRGSKLFELTNHLGNVLATISDRKLQHTGDNATVDYYLADVINAQDYYPFGMGMPGRSYTAAAAGSYRYGFNGKENDNEVKGTGNQQDYGMRVYDPRAGRFLSVDLLTKSYPELTPYQYASNTPIQAIDLDGLEKVTVHQRAFAPWDAFGSVLPFQGAYKGDNRNFSLNYSVNNKPVTSRIVQIAKLDLSTATIVASNVYSHPSIGPWNFYGPKGSSTETPKEQISISKDKLGIEYDANFSGHDARISGVLAPLINFTGIFRFNVENSNLKVDFTLLGKSFPAYESFIEDENHTRISISTYGVNSKGEIMKLMQFKDSDPVEGQSSSIIIPLDAKGNFKGTVKLPPYLIGEAPHGGEFTIDEWNKMMLSHRAAADVSNGSNSNTTNNNNNASSDKKQ